MGSLDAARRIDSRATASVTPSTSNSTLAGRITATQVSTPPLPVPMRTSSGFFVTDLSGNTRSQTLPRRFMKRVIATRAASICLVSSQHRSSACSPYSPKATVLQRVAIPVRWPRCILRYFTLSGINGIAIPRAKSNSAWGGPAGAGRPASPFHFGFAFANPAFDSQLAVHRAGFGKAVIDVGAERVQGHAALVIHFRARQLGAAQPAGATDL